MESQTTFLPYSRQSINSEDILAVSRVLESDFLTQGPTLESFEHELSKITGARHAIAVSSGTAALQLITKALGMNENSTGVTSPITFAAGANCFLYNNSKVVFSDVDPHTGILNPDDLEKTLEAHPKKNESTNTVIITSLSGHTPDLSCFRAITKNHGYYLIEDAAHSLGGSYSNLKHTHMSGSCTHTDAAILSFHPVKHICTGEGGAVLTNNKDLAEKIRLLRSHGIHRPFTAEGSKNEIPSWYYEQIDLGWNMRLTDLQAALGLSQLKRLPSFLEKRRTLAENYHSAFKALPFREIFTHFPHTNEHAYHLFMISFYNPEFRNKAHEFLKSKNIGTQVHYRPIYEFPYYRTIAPYPELPGSSQFASKCLSIPLFPDMTRQDQTRVIEAMHAFCKTVKTSNQSAEAISSKK